MVAPDAYSGNDQFLKSPGNKYGHPNYSTLIYVAREKLNENALTYNIHIYVTLYIDCRLLFRR